MENNKLQKRIRHLEKELHKKQYRHAVSRALFSWLLVLMLAAIFVALMVDLPFARIQSDNMEPRFLEGDIVLLQEQPFYERGDVIAFYFNTKMLVRRCIAFEGETVNVDQDGYVTVDGVPLTEPYVKSLSQGVCSIDLPFKVPKGSIFVMADNRESGLDSRNVALGTVMRDQIVGTVQYQLWPLDRFGIVTN